MRRWTRVRSKQRQSNCVRISTYLCPPPFYKELHNLNTLCLPLSILSSHNHKFSKQKQPSFIFSRQWRILSQSSNLWGNGLLNTSSEPLVSFLYGFYDVGFFFIGIISYFYWFLYYFVEKGVCGWVGSRARSRTIGLSRIWKPASRSYMLGKAWSFCYKLFINFFLFCLGENFSCFYCWFQWVGFVLDVRKSWQNWCVFGCWECLKRKFWVSEKFNRFKDLLICSWIKLFYISLVKWMCGKFLAWKCFSYHS